MSDDDGVAKAIEAIDAKILELLTKGTTSHADSVLKLAEARAWLTNPAQPHGGRAAAD